MAMTPAEKMKAYRERLKEKGTRRVTATLTESEQKLLYLFAKTQFPEAEATDVFRLILVAATKRLTNQIKQGEKLRLISNDNQVVDDYYKYCRTEYTEGLTLSAEKFLELRLEVEELSKAELN